MDTSSPVVASAITLLRRDLYEHLDEVEFLALKYDSWSDVDIKTARAAIPDLVTVIRGVLVLHEAEDDGGKCRTCGEIWPCAALSTIHRLVKDPDREFVKILDRARGYE
jgi:hypothetical protein